jgi:pyruvate/2-oxoglutarate dehydrogenase complex dihydrolipoamide acyltransferase (E2) component
VAVIETDKVNVDIRTTHGGVITQYFAGEGDTVVIDAEFFEIDSDAKAGSAAPPKEPTKAAEPEPTPAAAKVSSTSCF